MEIRKEVEMPQRYLLHGSLLLVAAALLGAMLFSAEADAGVTRTYVVLYKGNASSAGSAAAIEKAGGTLVSNYSQIGVVIARSASANFAASLKKDARIEGVSATDRFATRVDNDVAAGDVVSAAAGVASAGAFPADDLGELQWDMAQINATEAHAITGGSASIVVGDIDTGLDFTHPDLAPNVDFDNSVSCVSGSPDTDPAAWNDRNGHGTHTAGTIAASANNIGIVGVAPDVKIAAIKGGNDDGYFFPEAVICSFMWAGSHGIHVTNNSYFADPWLFNCRNDAEQRAIWKAEQRAIKYAMSQGVVVVSATGNENIDLSKKNIDFISPDFPPGNEQEREVTNACVQIPVEIPGVIGVSGVGPDSTKSFYSSYGVGVTDVTAPGGDSFQRPNPFGRVLSTYAHDAPVEGVGGIKFLLDRNRVIMDPPGCVDAATGVPAPGCVMWVYQQGTSMASPHAAGVAALIMSAHEDISRGAVGAFLAKTATGQPCPPNPYEPVAGFAAICRGGPAHNGFYGHGLVNAEAAVAE
jgi:subtilisin family serine protease